ncbi:MAG TPA: hypothetical protein EYQ50_25405 [Verrucomicrobiales bacterium]|nr:hypothetical protein [Verrucomicrobiales bacterium]
MKMLFNSKQKQILLIGLILISMVFPATAGKQKPTDRVMKVLPHLLDQQGKHLLSPSLYERDAYQAFLRSNPEEVSTTRFDIKWKSKRKKKTPLKLRIQLLGSEAYTSKPFVREISTSVKHRILANWSSIALSSREHEEIGKIIAWRVSLWADEKEIAHQQSFLWPSSSSKKDDSE